VVHGSSHVGSCTFLVNNAPGHFLPLCISESIVMVTYGAKDRVTINVKMKMKYMIGEVGLGLELLTDNSTMNVTN